MQNNILLIGLALICLPTLAQTDVFSTQNPLKQDELCSVSSPDAMMQQCKDGQILLYTPDIFGNEQLPINIAGFVCDFNHPIVWNNGGVSCVFTTARKSSW